MDTVRNWAHIGIFYQDPLGPVKYGKAVRRGSPSADQEPVLLALSKSRMGIMSARTHTSKGDRPVAPTSKQKELYNTFLSPSSF
jgi:hypothetical protein